MSRKRTTDAGCPAADADKALFAIIARSICGAPRAIQLRHVRNCLQADPACGEGIARALGMRLDETD